MSAELQTLLALVSVMSPGAVGEVVRAVSPLFGAGGAALCDRLVLSIRKSSFSKDIQV